MRGRQGPEQEEPQGLICLFYVQQEAIGTPTWFAFLDGISGCITVLRTCV